MPKSFSVIQQQRLIEANKAEYAERYDALHFLSPTEAASKQAERETLLASLVASIETGYNGTKLDTRRMSPGCRLCAEGKWSCLFINGQCNAKCFYCPTAQDEIGLPTTNMVNFRTPSEYITYLERFGFTGASISGGEPLLTPKRSLAFVRAIKKHFGDNMYVWLYTNGILATPDLMAELRDAGLNEIRFDIGATGYKLDNLRNAVGKIPAVTVEIPAIADELSLMQQKMHELADAGANHLNLHQLRLTPYNYDRLMKRNYTYLHGEKITVLDSETAALSLIAYGVEKNIDLPVNYCSFVYKNRYQNLGSRNRNAEFARRDFDVLTENGYLRSIALDGASADVRQLADQFRQAGVPAALWQVQNIGKRIMVDPSLLGQIDFSPFQMVVSYVAARQQPGVTYRNPFTEVKVTPSVKVVVERIRAVADVALSPAEAAEYVLMLEGKRDSLPESVAALVQFESIPYGLQNYF